MKCLFTTSKFLLFFSLVFLTSASVFGQAKTEEWFIADKTVDCQGVAPQKCLVVREVNSKDWKYFYGTIKNFRFRENYTQKIRVSVAPRKNVPADAAAFDYKLIKTVSRNKTDGNTLEEARNQMKSQNSLTFGGGKWTIFEIEGKPAEATATIEFDEKEKRFGAKICNGMGGSYEQTGASVKFSSVIGTLMACEEPIQSTENRFRAAVEKVTRGERSGDRIILYAGSKAILKLSAAAKEADGNKSLENVKWTLLEIENEKVEASDKIPFLQFDGERKMYSGFSGCNRISGGYEASGASLKLRGGAMTRMACLDAAQQTTETKMTQALTKISRYVIKDGALHLYDGDKVLLKLISSGK